MNTGRVTTLLILLPALLLGNGTVYLVLGSDTAIWDGMSVNQYQCTYDPGLYLDPNGNAYQVMDPAFRAPLTDSYGTPMKMTWWMMAGNIFRYATNTNVPVPNIMTMYLMKKYHGENIIANGDELSLHYHTFTWTDYDLDGMYFWNQALDFEECHDDWDVTLAQLLIEEDVFPVSFRSGWHYMDNNWQHELNEILPFSMHNVAPWSSFDPTEPTDNNIDWSQATTDYIPYQPAIENYQLPGDGPGWQVRSHSFQGALAGTYMDDIFSAASEGVDQVACIWAHLPESDFPENMAAVHELITATAEQYPEVSFRYCTGVEAMQRYLGSTDQVPPGIQVDQQGAGDQLTFTVTLDEPLFQPQPIVALKFKDGSYRLHDCLQQSENVWVTGSIEYSGELSKIGVAATDTAGNLTTTHVNLVPDDIYIDNLDNGYREIAGSFTSSGAASWGPDSRIAEATPGSPVEVSWEADILAAAPYHIYFQVPFLSAEACDLKWFLWDDGDPDTVVMQTPVAGGEWIYLGTPTLQAGNQTFLVLHAEVPEGQDPVHIPLDVVKLTAQVRARDFRVSTNLLNYGEVSLDSTHSMSLTLTNLGFSPLEFSSLTSSSGLVSAILPMSLGPMSSVDISVLFEASTLGPFQDSLIIVSNDPMRSETTIKVSALVEYPFVVVDNDDEHGYSEEGEWMTSVAEAWGASSRYAWAGSGAWAQYEFELSLPAIYDLYEIVPATVNSVDDALYITKVDGIAVDSVNVDQNAGSGAWAFVGRNYLPANVPVTVEVHDPEGGNTDVVLRADALKLQMLHPVDILEDSPTVPGAFLVHQNVPNPFNGETRIRYVLPVSLDTRISIYDLAGRMIHAEVKSALPAGTHEFRWSGHDLNGELVETGIYLCHLRAGDQTQTIKMLLLK